MMELQGALGLAQLSKLKAMIARQKDHKNRLKGDPVGYQGDPFSGTGGSGGDTATFLAFSLPDQEKTKAIKNLSKKVGLGLIYFFENDWHYYRNWEHLLLQKPPAATAGPFRWKRGSGN